MSEFFYLRGIEYPGFLEEFERGEVLCYPPKGVKLVKPVKSEKVVGTNPNDPVYEYRHQNIDYLVYTTNNDDHKICRVCRKEIVRSEGIPYHIAFFKENGKTVMRVLTEGAYHSEGCMYQAYCAKKHLSRYRYSLSYIQLLHSLRYGNQVPLLAAPDPDLLSEYGGGQSREEYDQNRHQLQSSPNMIVIPTRIQYYYRK